jgi:hypothetical protein
MGQPEISDVPSAEKPAAYRWVVGCDFGHGDSTSIIVRSDLIEIGFERTQARTLSDKEG